jgi:hypothetical protein
MAISHKDHDHPNTPAARAACRKAMTATDYVTGATPDGVVGVATPAKMTVVPRRRGDGGVVKGMKAAGPGRTLKRSNTLVKSEGDLADMPRMLAYGVRLAWAADLDVVVGEKFNEAERRILIKNEVGEVALTWRENRPEGIWAIWVRNYDSSRQFTVESVQEAMEITATREAWDDHGNLK